MQLHQLSPTYKEKRKKRIGRGGKRGSSSGRGMKGQRSRAGRKFKPIIREWIKKYPKKRGHKQKIKSNKSKAKIVSLNLEALEKEFNSNEKVNPQILLERKMVRRAKGRVPKVKILSRGKITKALIIEGCQVSKSAQEKIEKSNGEVRSKPQSSKAKVENLKKAA